MTVHCEFKDLPHIETMGRRTLRSKILFSAMNFYRNRLYPFLPKLLQGATTIPPSPTPMKGNIFLSQKNCAVPGTSSKSRPSKVTSFGKHMLLDWRQMYKMYFKNISLNHTFCTRRSLGAKKQQMDEGLKMLKEDGRFPGPFEVFHPQSFCCEPFFEANPLIFLNI